MPRELLALVPEDPEGPSSLVRAVAQRVSSVGPRPPLPPETLRLFEEANEWLARHRCLVNRTPTPWGEHVAVCLPTGVSSQFTVTEPGDYEEGIVLAVDAIRG